MSEERHDKPPDFFIVDRNALTPRERRYVKEGDKYVPIGTRFDNIESRLSRQDRLLGLLALLVFLNLGIGNANVLESVLRAIFR